MSLVDTEKLAHQLGSAETGRIMAAQRTAKRIVMIRGSLAEHRMAWDLVERGNVDRALVVSGPLGDHVSFEAWRISETSYAWRTAAMSVPAFMPIIPDTRPDVAGMPRWEWDLYGRSYPAHAGIR